MTERALFRLTHIREAIGDINDLLRGASVQTLHVDKVARAAFERFLEIISEASRGVPDAWKQADASHIPWRRIADLGNHIRHGYDKLDVESLWSVYQDDLGPLEDAVNTMIDRHRPDR